TAGGVFHVTFTAHNGVAPDAVQQFTLTVSAADRLATFHGNGTWSIDTAGNGTFATTVTFGLPGDTPLVGDWNGDGRGKIGIARPDGKGSVAFDLDTNGDAVFELGVDADDHFGLPGDRVIVGDWNGDSRTKIGVVRPEGGTLLFALDTNGSGVFEFGAD